MCTSPRLGCFALGAMLLMAIPSSTPVQAGRCPAALESATRLVVVRTADMDATSATLETFERPSTAEAWRPAGGLREAVVGLKGLAWGTQFTHLARPGEPIKQEGDRRSPAGIYAIGAPFGFAPSDEPGYMQLATDQHMCVEDASSPLYGRIVPRSQMPKTLKADQMAAEPLYRTGIVVDYPADRAAKAGSCIFIHVWRQRGKGTAGCVAMEEADVTALRAWLSAAPSAIAILPAIAADRFAGCLP